MHRARRGQCGASHGGARLRTEAVTEHAARPGTLILAENPCASRYLPMCRLNVGTATPQKGPVTTPAAVQYGDRAGGCDTHTGDDAREGHALSPDENTGLRKGGGLRGDRRGPLTGARMSRARAADAQAARGRVRTAELSRSPRGVRWKATAPRSPRGGRGQTLAIPRGASGTPRRPPLIRSGLQRVQATLLRASWQQPPRPPRPPRLLLPGCGDGFLSGPRAEASAGGAWRNRKHGRCLPRANVLRQQLVGLRGRSDAESFN